LREAYLHLKVAPGASLKEVRQQFRQLAMCYHPDRPGGSSEKMKQILTAYDVIKKVMDQRHTCED
jgi:curved DNA-binding protein CbpA